MDSKMNVHQMLEKAGDLISFEDGDKNHIWHRSGIKGRRIKSPMRWLVPVAAALTVLVTVAAVPQARAAVLDFIGKTFNVMEYLSTDQPARPEASDMAELIQTDIPAKITVLAHQDGQWVKNLKVHIDEALYDGEFVYIKYIVDSNGEKDFMGGFATPSAGQSIKYKEFLPGDVDLPDKSKLYQMIYGQRPLGNGLWMDVAKYGAGDLVGKTGKVELTFTINFNNMVETATGGNGSPAGEIWLQFMLDLDAGRKSAAQIDVTGQTHALSGEAVVTDEHTNAKMSGEEGTQTFTNKKISLSGCSLVVDSMLYKPTEISARVHLVTPKELSLLLDPLTFVRSINIVLKDGDEIIGRSDTVTPDGNGGAYINISGQMILRELKEITFFTSIQYKSSINGAPLEINKIITGPFYNDSPYDPIFEEAAIEGGTFTINLTK